MSGGSKCAVVRNVQRSYRAPPLPPIPRSDDNQDAVIQPGTLRFPYAQTAERAPISCLFLGNRRLGKGRTISLPRSTPGLRRSQQRRRYRAPHGLLTFKVLMADRVNPVRVLSDDGAVMNVISNPPADWSGSNQSYCLCSHAGYLWGARPGRPVLPDRP